MSSQAVAANNLIFELPSILEPMDLKALFREPQAFEVELGCGDGSFLVNYARLHQERNFLGVERLGGRIRKVDRKGRRLGLSNLRGVRIESAYLLQYLLPAQSVSALHLYFPDPWPKRKHWKNRLVNERFPDLARRVLVDGGIVYLRTDDKDYFEQMLAMFEPAKFFEAVETPGELKALLTDFEAEFNARGIPTNYAAYRRL